MSDKLINYEYRVLARKYRPQKFADLVGQEILVNILTNSITQNRIAHAYILTGVRGIGKTTTARLIAMSLNCEQRIDNTCEPCGVCNSCISVREDRSLDVIEMDAASRTGVDDIREIIDNIKYKPVSSKYKIFIIDEVHMLSKSAFNALLKTLEEPPEHVKFIFATTEVKKIPITIISRCQRFDLHRIEKEKLINHLINIASKEKIKINNEAISLIVRSADGSVRDGLSLLDQAIVNGPDEINASTVINMLGLADRGKIFDLIDVIFKGDAPQALNIYNEMYKSGADTLMIFSEMLNVVHFITQIKIAAELKSDILIPELERIKGFEMSEKISMSSLGMIWQVLFKGYEELQSGNHLFQHGEMIIIRLIFLYQGPTPDDLIRRAKLENNNEENVNNNLKENSDKKIDKQILNDLNFDEKNNKKLKNEIVTQSHISGNLKITSFRIFVDLFYQKKEGMLHTYLYNDVKLISFQEGSVIINNQKITDLHFNRTIAKLISKWTGRIWQVSSSNSNLGKTLQEEDLIIQQKEIEKMKNDPKIKIILETFPDVNIHSISDNMETTKDDISGENLLQKKEK